MTKRTKARLISAAQSTGRIGKSTVLDSLLAYLDFIEAAYRATDADAEHRTLSDRYADVDKVSLIDPDDLVRLFKNAGKKAPVEIIDIPAQKTDFIIDVIERFNVLPLMAEDDIRATILLFAADDPAAEASLQKIVSCAQDEVDYIVIFNPARYKSKHYQGSGLHKTLKAWNTPEIELPAITQLTLDELQRARAKAGRWLSLGEAAHSEFVGKYAQHEVQHFLNRMYVQWHNARHLILPEGVEPKHEPIQTEAPEKKSLNLEVSIPE